MEEKCHFCRYAVCHLSEIPSIYLLDFTLDVTLAEGAVLHRKSSSPLFHSP